MHRQVLGAALVAAALVGPASVAAQPAPSATLSATPAASAAPSATPQAPAASRAEQAASSFQLGREAFKAEDFAHALELFKQSQGLEASEGTLLNIALTEEKLGKVASAWLSYQRVIEQMKPDDDRTPIAREGLARMALRVPRLKVERAAGAPLTLAIKIDGAPLAANQVGVEQPLDPGPHVVTTRVTGFDERRYEVTLSEGQRLPLAVEPGKRTLVEVPVGSAAPEPGGPNPGRVAAFVLGGAGIGGLGVGIATGAMAISARDALAVECPSPPACSASGRRLEGEGRALAAVSTGALIFGGAAIATGLVLVFTVGGGKSAFVSASAAPGGGALSATGRF